MHDSMIIKVDNKVINGSNRIYLNEYYTLLFIYLVSESGIITYYLVKLVCNLGSFTASIVVRVESFEIVYQDNWLDSKISIYMSKLLFNHIYQYSM